MQWAYDMGDIALALQHQRLPMAADVRQQLDAFWIAHQGLCVVAPEQRVIVACFWHHELMPGISRTARKQYALLVLEELGIEIRRNGKLRNRPRDFARWRESHKWSSPS